MYMAPNPELPYEKGLYTHPTRKTHVVTTLKLSSQKGLYKPWKMYVVPNLILPLLKALYTPRETNVAANLKPP